MESSDIHRLGMTNHCENQEVNIIHFYIIIKYKNVNVSSVVAIILVLHIIVL